MLTETIQITRERSACDPVRYAEEQMENGADYQLSWRSAQLPATFADLFEYPDETWEARLTDALASPIAKSDVAADLGAFCTWSCGLTLTELQELYTQTFDLNPACALEIGYHLFGEDYKRGAFLAKLRETQADLDLGQERQLPDHLPVLLRLLVHLDDDELRYALVRHCLIPGLEKIIKAFKDENPYLVLVKSTVAALRLALAADDGLVTA